MTVFLPIAGVEVRAFQWLGQPLDDYSIPPWANGPAHIASPGSGTMEVTTRNGRTNARLGEWIVQYADGSIDIAPDALFRIYYDVQAGLNAEHVARKHAAAARHHKEAEADAQAEAHHKAAVEAEAHRKAAAIEAAKKP
jgi:hypothetical protein